MNNAGFLTPSIFKNTRSHDEDEADALMDLPHIRCQSKDRTNNQLGVTYV